MKLEPARAAASPVHGRVALVLARPGTGAEGLLGALAELPGVATRPVGTGLLAHGVPRLFGNFLVGEGGLSALVGEQDFLAAVRTLADEPLHALAAQTRSRVVADWSTGAPADLAAAIYPDAEMITEQHLAALKADPDGELRRLAGAMGLAPARADLERAAARLRDGIPPASLPPAAGPADPSVDSPFRDRLVIVLGAPRSGTTWLTGMLLAHPATSGLEEQETWVFQGLRDLWGSADLAAWLDRRGVAAAVRRFADAVFSAHRDHTRPDATWFVEKTPGHVFRLPEIRLACPDAAYVHIVRDGRDVARSMAEVVVQDGVDSVAEGARHWAVSVRAVRREAPSMARFREVRYEDLMADPVNGVAGLLGWAGLPVADDLRAALAARQGVRVSRLGTSGPVGPGKWQELDPSDLDAVEREAGPVLRELGYGRRRRRRFGLRRSR